MITQLKFVGIPTRDQTRALKFYTEQLGFEVATDQPFDDKQRWIELRIANASTRVCRAVHAGRSREPHRDVLQRLVHLRRRAGHLSAAARAWGRIRVGAGEAAVGRVRGVQGSGRQSVRAVLALKRKRAANRLPPADYRGLLNLSSVTAAARLPAPSSHCPWAQRRQSSQRPCRPASR